MGRPSLRDPRDSARPVPRAAAPRTKSAVSDAITTRIGAATSGDGTGTGHHLGVDRSGRRSKNGGQGPVVPPPPPIGIWESSENTSTVQVGDGVPVLPYAGVIAFHAGANRYPDFATTHAFACSHNGGTATEVGRAVAGTSLIAERPPWRPRRAVARTAGLSFAAGQPNAHGDVSVTAPTASTAATTAPTTYVRSRLGLLSMVLSYPVPEVAAEVAAIAAGGLGDRVTNIHAASRPPAMVSTVPHHHDPDDGSHSAKARSGSLANPLGSAVGPLPIRSSPDWSSLRYMSDGPPVQAE